MNKFTLVLALLFSIPLAGNAIDNIGIQEPQPNQRCRDLLDVVAVLSGHILTDTIRASVGSQTVLLTHLFEDKYYGQLSLKGMPQGLLQLVILAKTVTGDTITATQTFIYDRAPFVTVESPLPYSSYQSKIHIKATVTDPGYANCEGIISCGSFDISFVNSIDTLIDPYPNARTAISELAFYGVDSLAQVFSAIRLLDNDKSSYLTPVYTDTGTINDVDSTRILWTIIPEHLASGFKIYNTVTSSSKFINIDIIHPKPDRFNDAGLCKGGAFFVSAYSDTEINYLYLWRGDSLINISQPLGINSLLLGVKSADNTLMWTSRTGKTAITDLTTLNSIITNIPEVTFGKELSKDGKRIVYSAGSPGNCAIYSYSVSSQVITQITTSGNNIYPVIDNNSIAYTRQSPTKNSIHLRDGVTDYNLGDVNNYYNTYSLSNGYMAFIKEDSMNVHQIWLRTPAKVLKKVTSYPAESIGIDKLSPNGRLVFSHWTSSFGYMRYYYDSITANVPISGPLGGTYFVHDSFYLALGGTLYAYHIPPIILPPQITAISLDSAIKGSTITIKGLHFDNAVGVSFGGTAAASFTIVSDSVITAVVGAGSSGNVSVCTPVGTGIFSGFHFAFHLPPDFFHIIYNDVTCKGAKDGSILFITGAMNEFRVVISGATNIDTIIKSESYHSYNFSAGTYNICLSLVSHPEYQQCFTGVIAGPKDLSAYIAVNQDDRQVTLSLTGAALYHIKLNDAEITTGESQVTLNLNKGLNKIAVSTDKLCQGIITKNITIGAGPIAYPNPFRKAIHLNLGRKETVQKMVITIYNASGKIVYTHGYSNQSGVITIDLPDLSDGLYILKLVADNQETIFKLMKK